MNGRTIVYILAALLVGSAGEALAEPLSGHALSRFLGPVSPSVATWERDIAPEAEFYFGKFNPPLSGDISIAISLPPWKPDLGPGPPVDGSGRFGALSGEWSRDEYEGIYQATFGFADRKGRMFELTIRSPVEVDLDRIAGQMAGLPIISSGPTAPFHDAEVRKQLSRFLGLVLLPALLLLTILLPILRWKAMGATTLRKAGFALVMSVFWFAALVALVLVTPRSDNLGVIIQLPRSPFWWPGPILVILMFMSALCVILVNCFMRFRNVRRPN